MPELSSEATTIDTVASATPEASSQALSRIEKLANVSLLRKGLILVLLAIIWQLVASHYNNPLLLPTFTETLEAIRTNVLSGQLPLRAWISIKVLLLG
jgi:NitT/TauT family transport system permease protein